jgi:voltage-gated potassium channel
MNCLDDFKNALQWGNSFRVDLIKSKPLGYLVLLAILVTVAVGLLLFIVDPNIHSLHDGVWSAWVTMTHVGFGDVVPISFLGRLLAAALILFGLVFFSMFTALVSVALIGKNIEEIGGSVKKLGEDASTLSGGEDRILEELVRLHKRLDQIESRISSISQDRPATVESVDANPHPQMT